MKGPGGLRKGFGGGQELGRSEQDGRGGQELSPVGEVLQERAGPQFSLALELEPPELPGGREFDESFRWQIDAHEGVRPIPITARALCFLQSMEHVPEKVLNN